MPVITYSIPVSALTIPSAPYDAATLGMVQGTNFDYPVAQFSDDVNDGLFLAVALPEVYVGGGITLRLRWLSPQIVGDVAWEATYMETGGSGEVWDEVFADGPDQVVSTTPGVAGETEIADLVLTGVAAYAAGRLIRIFLYRNAAAGADTLVGEATLVGVDILFTVPASATTTTVNGISPTVTIDAVVDEASVSTLGATISIGLPTTLPAGQYVVESDGIGGVAYVPFECSGGLFFVDDAWITFFSNVAEFIGDLLVVVSPVTITGF